MSDKPVILVTRKLPEVVEARINRDYEGRLNPDDAFYSKDELIERAHGADGILPYHTEIFDADLIGRLPDEVKIVANFSVGFDHVDFDAVFLHQFLAEMQAEPGAGFALGPLGRGLFREPEQAWQFISRDADAAE